MLHVWSTTADLVIKLQAIWEVVKNVHHIHHNNIEKSKLLLWQFLLRCFCGEELPQDKDQPTESQLFRWIFDQQKKGGPKIQRLATSTWRRHQKLQVLSFDVTTSDFSATLIVEASVMWLILDRAIGPLSWNQNFVSAHVWCPSKKKTTASTLIWTPDSPSWFYLCRSSHGQSRHRWWTCSP